VPKGKIFEVLESIKAVTAVPPVNIGDVVIPDVCGTGVSVVATRYVRRG